MKLKLIVLFLFSTLLCAAESIQVSDIGSSADMISRGNIEGFSRNASSVFENPASLHHIQKASFSTFGTRIFDEAKYANLAYAWNSKWGHFGLGHMFVYVDGVASTTENDSGQFIPDRYFGYRNSLTKFSYQYSIKPSLHIGSSLNYFRTRLDDITGNGVNADLGLLFHRRTLSVSILTKNILRPLKLTYNEGDDENLPLQLILSSNYRWPAATLYGQIKKRSGHKDALKAAGVSFHPIWLSVITLNGGLKEYDAINQNFTTGSMGVGIIIDTWKFNYAYEKSEHPDFNNFNYFSISWLR
ncbi:hypothetical protein DID80_07350 [Candidatus Marinamargulisbacteria bacterium SCGC AAA071-K20]|nr:hypothetical protein DID80_07350 [Candidatus Marinamargulisbacteria bacterium SCGC AAA071-K20]